MIVLSGTFVLDLAVAVQAFGRRPSVFSKIRDEPEAPYDVGVCGQALTPTSLGFTIADLKPIEFGNSFTSGNTRWGLVILALLVLSGLAAFGYWLYLWPWAWRVG